MKKKEILLFKNNSDILASKIYANVEVIKVNNDTGELILYSEKDKEVLNLKDFSKIIIDNRNKD